MVFNLSCHAKRQRRSGMTLVELVIASGITAIIALVICSSMIYSGRSLWGLSNYVELDNASRNSLEYLMADLRDASRVVSLTSNTPNTTLTVANAATGATVQYVWNPTQTTLTRYSSTYNRIVLTNCDDFRIEVKSRAMTNSWEPVDVGGNWSQGKFVIVTWHCSKTINVSRAINTEKIQTARIMLRNQHLSRMLQL